MNPKTTAWGKKNLSKDKTIKQTRIISNGTGQFVTQVTLTDESGTEATGWHTVDGTEASTREQAEHLQLNVMYDTEIPTTQEVVEPQYEQITNPDGTLNREATFLEAQKVQSIEGADNGNAESE